MDHQTWINMNSRELLKTDDKRRMCSKSVTLDQDTIIASSAGQQLNADTWDDELHADSRLNADSANSSIRTATPTKSSAFKTSLHLPSSSRMQSLSLQASLSGLDCIVILSVHSHRVAADHGKELSLFFCRGTDSEHVPRIELSVNTFHFEVSLLQFLLQPTMPDIQMFHSSDASVVAKCSGNIGVSSRTIGKKPIPQNSKLYCISLASFKTSLMLMISLSPQLSACCPFVLL